MNVRNNLFGRRSNANLKRICDKEISIFFSDSRRHRNLRANDMNVLLAAMDTSGHYQRVIFYFQNCLKNVTQPVSPGKGLMHIHAISHGNLPVNV